MKKWKTLSTEIIKKNPWWEYRLDRFRMPNGYEGEYHYVHPQGEVLVIPVTAEGQILLHRQYRYLFDRMSLEFPAGHVEDGQTYEEAVRMELAQECGMAAGTLTFVGKLAPSVGEYDAYVHVYVASDLESTPATPDPTEDFELMTMSPAQVDEAILSGEMWDGYCVGPWMISKPHVETVIDRLLRVR